MISQVSAILTHAEQNARLKGMHPVETQEIQISAVCHTSFLHGPATVIEDGDF